MKKKFLYILTENLNFFYKLNKILTEKKISFKVLTLGSKIPSIASLILTTSEDVPKFETKNNNVKFLIYSPEIFFEDYILRVIAAYRIEYKEHYSKLTFSIDPGKRIGLMVFLDNYYLDSYCCYKMEELIEKIIKIIKIFQKNNPYLIDVDFKFGRGVLSITYELVKRIYKIFKNRQNMRVYLIDESRTSKIKNLNKFKGKKLSKDEISALILAMREGMEVTHENYIKIFNQIKSKKLKLNPINKRDSESNNGASLKIEDIIEKVLSGEYSLIESSQLIKNDDI
ncbi:MAG: hypothetical protein ACFFD5_12555 [Candidatus Thorarchaeota archaeon]